MVTTRRIAFFVAICALGCEFKKPLPPRLVHEQGERTYAQDPNAVFEACVTALQSQGYALAVVRPDLGRIETQPAVRTTSGHVVQNTVVVNTTADAWTLFVQPTGAGTVVTAYPRRFVDGVENNQFFLSELHEQWDPLFMAIGNYLPAPTQLGAAR